MQTSPETGRRLTVQLAKHHLQDTPGRIGLGSEITNRRGEYRERGFSSNINRQEVLASCHEKPFPDAPKVENYFRSDLSREKLGRYYKVPLAHYMNSLAMWLQPIREYDESRVPRADNGKTLESFLDGAKKHSSKMCAAVLIGPPGVGKTASIIHQASKRFIIYLNPGSGLTEGGDFNLISTVHYLDSALSAHALTTVMEFEQWKHFHSHRRLMVKQEFECEILARILFLRWLQERKPSLSPAEFFLAQINGPSLAISQIRQTLRSYDAGQITNELRATMAAYFSNSEVPVVAIDEAQILAEKGALMAESALHEASVTNWRESFSVKNDYKTPLTRYKRGYLVPLCEAAMTHMPIIIAGTKLSPSHLDILESTLMKPNTNCAYIMRFPVLDVNASWERLGSVLQLPSPNPPKSLARLVGRFRWTDYIVTELYQHPASDLERHIATVADKELVNMKAQIEKVFSQHGFGRSSIFFFFFFLLLIAHFFFFSHLASFPLPYFFLFIFF
jgi:hypothetical protein